MPDYNDDDRRPRGKNRYDYELPFSMSLGQSICAGATMAVSVVGGFMAMRYHVAKPHQYLVRTGLGIKDLSVSKKAVQWQLQKINLVDLRPRNYNFRLHNMSKEKVEFSLPINFTIGPIDPLENSPGFKLFARRMHEMDEETLGKTILGIVEGETRGLTSILTIEEMFNAKDRFREDVVKKIQTHLDVLGLTIYNANIREMGDFDEHNKYFEYRKQRAIQTANYEAQVRDIHARQVDIILYFIVLYINHRLKYQKPKN